MKNHFSKLIFSLVLTSGLAITLTWSEKGYACSSEAYISAVCIMAVPWTNLSGYTLANGSTINVNDNQALYSLIGTTYGGTPGVNFKLPDLRGRVVIGAGSGGPVGNYSVGNIGGSQTITLQPANVPVAPHVHSLVTQPSGVTVTFGMGTLVGSTPATGLTATTNLANLKATAAGSGFTLNGSTGGNYGTSASGSSLGSYSGTIRIYSDATPSVAMKAGSISGSAPVTFNGTPTTTIAGSATTTLSGNPAISISGVTGMTTSPASMPISLLPPYLAMNYFIATQGLYPSRN